MVIAQIDEHETLIFLHKNLRVQLRTGSSLQNSGYILFTLALVKRVYNLVPEPHHCDAFILPQLRTMAVLRGTTHLRRSICKIKGQTPSRSQAATSLG